MTELNKRDDALLPCPFCGVEASEVEDQGHSTGYNVGCFNGDCIIEPYTWADTKAEAIAAWNTRALPAIDPAAIREAALVSAVAKKIGEEHGWVRQERLDEAEAKLAKAMAGLRKIADHKHFSWDQGWIQNAEARIASAALAELEDDK